LAKNGYDKLINENEISNLINNNCIKIAQYLSEIIIYYEDVGNNYYLDFLDLFNNISKLSEKDINNYFYNYLYSAKSKGRIPKPKMEYHPLPSTLRNNRKNNYYINNQTINNYNNININNINEYGKNYKIKKTNNDKLYIDYLKNKISPPFLPISNNNKNYTLVLDITNTLINIKYANPQGQILIPNLRPGIFSFLNSVKPLYELVAFSSETREFSDVILNEIEKNKKFFDFKLYKDHCTLYKNRFVKDITKLGRDIRKIIIVDDDENNFVLNKENGIKIKPFLGEENNNDTSLFELKKILILFERMGLDDVRKGIKSYEKDIKDKISMNNLGK
jgi:TFIIF-interacting CTD phosphatase-like protein